jgi:hypothetical protein
MSFDYSESPYPIADYKADAHRGAWVYLAQPGSWWTAAERIAIAAACRDAAFCTLCAERKAALSPFSVTGEHSSDSELLNASDPLNAKVLDAAHRITTDSARLTESWVSGLLDEDFGFGHYVEMVSVIVNLVSIDSFHQALGLPLEPLPEPQAGEPDGYLPAGAAIDVAWVPMIYPANLSEQEEDIYFGAPQMGHVIRAMSLVPDAVRWLNTLSEAHYLPIPQVGDMSSSGHLCLSRMQTELIAARTSMLNDCFY